MKIKFEFLLCILVLTHSFSSSPIINFRLTDINAPILDIVMCENGDTVLVLTELNTIYMSQDKGFSFSNLNDVIRNTGKQQLEERENEVGNVSRIIQSPVDKSLLIFLGTHGINWIASDCGRNIKALNHGRKINEYIFHPTERNWGLASAFTLCEDFSGEPCRFYNELFVTKDLGENWQLLNSYTVQFGWGIIGEEHIKSGIPKQRILVIFNSRGKGDQKLLELSYKNDFIYSDDFFKSQTIGASKGNKFLLTKNNLFVTQVLDRELQEIAILTANSQDKIYNLTSIDIDKYVKIHQDNSNAFLDTSYNSIFLYIINNEKTLSSNYDYGDIYTSELNGVKYSPSLKNNFNKDFQKIKSIEGTYVSNIISEDFNKNNNNKNKNEVQEVTNQFLNFNKYFIETMITFNMGRSWTRIMAPIRKLSGHKYNCEVNISCYLNLHQNSGIYQTLFSSPAAPGLIISNGSVGKFLSFNQKDINTYLSSDGGLNWSEIKTGSHLYVIGNHGSIIILAEDQNLTDTIFYSNDEGLNFNEIKISNEKILIKNIKIYFISNSSNFIIYGEINKNGEKKGVIISLEFSTSDLPKCRNFDRPNNIDSDYETWTPNDGRDSMRCIMGKMAFYTKRKYDAKCRDELHQQVFFQNCDCSDEDYICDVGYERNLPFEPCTTKNNQFNFKTNSFGPPSDCVDTFSISKGYIKLQGNTCINGFKYDPIIINCPNSIFSLLGKSILAILFILATIGLIYIAFKWMLNN